MARSPGKADHRGAPRIPGVLSGISVGVVFVLVAAISLTARQEPPPTVAEFAPQAVEQIKQALPEQAEAPDADVAAAPDAAEAEEARDPDAAPTEGPTQSPSQEREAQREQRERDNRPGERPTEEAPHIEEPRVRRCVGDPPRQTEDPQSPPCVPYFDGDNGGATYKGVTANEIRVSIALQEFGGVLEPELNDLIAHFNRRYEFYGRKLVPTYYKPTDGTFAHPNPGNMIADAVTVDEEHKAFATIGYPDRKGAEHHHYDELARRGIISSAFRAQTIADSQRYQEFAPYEWNAMPPIDVILTGLGNLVCDTLAGDPPQGGGPQGDGRQFRDQLGQQPHEGPRIFGLVFQRNKDGSVPPVDVLEGRLASCGVQLAARVEDSAEVPQADNVVLQLRDAGVTTAVYLGDPGAMRASYMQSASNQAYFPEWVLSSYIDMDVDNVFQPGSAPAEQTRNVLGVTFRDRLLPRQQMPWYWAIRESSPQKDPSGGQYYPTMAVYRQLLQLASGIQMAGPDLNPEAFAEGLQSADFPNPGAGGPPSFQSEVDYDGRYWPTDTAALYFYDPSVPGTVDPSYPGAVCYVDEGRRHPAGAMPTRQQPFFTSCR